jgi:DNA replication protein DnaC
MSEKLIEYSNKLRLPALRTAVKKGEFDLKTVKVLESILTKEVKLRDDNAILSKIRVAQFPYKKYLLDLDENLLPQDLQRKLPELKSLDFIDKIQNIILIGNPGTGKTHVSIALGIEACNRGYKVKFCHVPSLITSLKESTSERRLNSFIATFLKYDLIILDELGYVSLDKEGAELLFQLLSARCELKSTIVTSNSTFDKWSEIFGDPIMTAAIIDRLAFKSHIVKMNGDSYRYLSTKEVNV